MIIEDVNSGESLGRRPLSLHYRSTLNHDTQTSYSRDWETQRTLCPQVSYQILIFPKSLPSKARSGCYRVRRVAEAGPAFKKFLVFPVNYPYCECPERLTFLGQT